MKLASASVPRLQGGFNCTAVADAPSKAQANKSTLLHVLARGTAWIAIRPSQRQVRPFNVLVVPSNFFYQKEKAGKTKFVTRSRSCRLIPHAPQWQMQWEVGDAKCLVVWRVGLDIKLHSSK